MKRIVLLSEGKGDQQSLPGLVKQLIKRHDAYDVVWVDRDVIRVQNIGKLLKNGAAFWLRMLQVACKRNDVGGVLLILDGDVDPVPCPAYEARFGTREFCAFQLATHLTSIATKARAGEAFSVAVAFAMKEIEAWILAVIDQMGGVNRSDGEPIPHDLTPPDRPEEIRGAKGALTRKIGGYKETADQEPLLAKLPVEVAIDRCRSFRHLDHAVAQIITAVRDGKPICSPPGDV